MSYRKLLKKGAAFSLAVMMGITAVPAAPALNVYAAEAQQDLEVVQTFNFDDGIDGWTYDKGWDWDYSGADKTAVAGDNGRLKFTVDYSKDKDKGWAQTSAVWRGDGKDIPGANRVTFDFYYSSDLLKAGEFKVKLVAQGGGEELFSKDTTVDLTQKTPDSGNVVKVPVIVQDFDAVADGKKMDTLALQVIGANTDYAGDVWIDNVSVQRAKVKDTWSVDSKVKVDDKKKAASVKDGKLSVTRKDSSTQEVALNTKVKLVDAKASDNTRQIYSYLQAVGSSDSVIFGHENDLFDKAGSVATSRSDVKDITGSIAGVHGIDTLLLTGNELGAEKYKKAYPTEPEPATPVEAAVRLSNHAIEDGSIVTLSAHMPNFSLVKKNADYKSGDKNYLKWDFKGYTPNNTDGDVMNNLLPGGKYNEKYTAYLDMIADYATQVKGTVLFRPFHENTGSWFWWGKAYCEPETYKSVWRYTVEYLRDEKDVHNFIYVYSPSNSNAATIEEYGERYPGDGYVDMVGFDMYDNSRGSDNSSWMTAFKNQIDVVEAFAKTHKKLFTVTETGIASDPEPGSNQTALLRQNNVSKDWFNQVLNAVSDSDASYFLLWANFGKQDGYYTPYVDAVNADGSLHGHETLDSFINFYNDGRSIFAANQKDALASMAGSTVTAEAAQTGVSGYVVSPVAGTRILKAVTLRAKLSGTKPETKVKFVLKAGKTTVSLNAKAGKNGAYTASLSKKNLAKLGKKTGTLALTADGKTVQKLSMIYNVKEPEADVCQIDNFEGYLGVDDQLKNAWTPNVGSDCTLKLSLNKSKKTEGSYAMKFDYDEADDGYAGASIGKQVDWSNCNALSFTMTPDGKNQKTVIQIQANGVCYEAYLNNYKAYRQNGKKQILVTIPFKEFCERDTAGNPKGGLVKNAKKIESFGLYVNAIADSSAVKNGRVKGTLYFDDITAVRVKSEKISFTKTSSKTYKNLQAQKVSLKKTKLTLKKGKTYKLSAKVTGKGDTTLTWYSSNPSVATVSKTGKITAKKAGTVKIIVKTRSGKKAVCTITVK